VARHNCGSKHPIDLDAMVAIVALEAGEQSLPAVVDSIRSGSQM
jgi:hypothetical protein